MFQNKKMERNKKMASINWMKATTQKAGAMKKHLGKIEREKGNHSNPNINIFLSFLHKFGYKILRFSDITSSIIYLTIL